MRLLLIIIISVVSLNVFASCDTGYDAMAYTENFPSDSFQKTKGGQMKITFGSKTFEATLVDNETVIALKEMLPFTLEMSELNGNEKYFRLSKNLPEEVSKPGTIQAGDLMLWGSNTLVLFYETFQTSYSYTRIGRINDPADLAQAVGSGSVKVTFEFK